MGRLLTFRQLQTVKGWPHSRQYTSKLVRDKKIPAPVKRPSGGLLNLWDEEVWDAFTRTFFGSQSQPLSLELTLALADALSTDSIDGVVAAVARMRDALAHEGATPSDVVVRLKASAVAGQAATTTMTNTT
jgi:hypothetical protein